MMNAQATAKLEHDKEGNLFFKLLVRIVPDFVGEHDALSTVPEFTFEKDAFVARFEHKIPEPVVEEVKTEEKPNEPEPNV